jgi:hypothetical protein
MLFFSLGISILLLIFTTLNQVTVDGKASLLIFLCIGPAFAILAVVALIYALIRWRKMGKRAGLPLLIQAICLLITAGVVTLSQAVDLNFRVHASGFNEVIGLVETNQLQPDGYAEAKLPPQYQYLSTFGSIRMQKENGGTTVLFYESIGLSSGSRGYVYRSNNAPPKDLSWCDTWRPLQQPQANWFVCVSN